MRMRGTVVQFKVFFLFLTLLFKVVSRNYTPAYFIPFREFNK